MENQEKNYERHDVENTPFSIMVETTSGEANICVGNQLITDRKFSNETEARKAIKKKDWDLILNMTTFLSYNLYNNIINQSKTNENGTN